MATGGSDNGMLYVIAGVLLIAVVAAGYVIINHEGGGHGPTDPGPRAAHNAAQGAGAGGAAEQKRTD